MSFNAWDVDHPSGTGWIRTASGRYVNLLAPNPDHINITDIAVSLSQICRFGGHLLSMYSVAEHSLHIAALLRRQFGNGYWTLCGLLHDATEAYMGDMVRPLKQAMPAYQAAEERMADAVGVAFGLPADWWKNPIVKQADEAALVWEMATVRDCEWRTPNSPAVVAAHFEAAVRALLPVEVRAFQNEVQP